MNRLPSHFVTMLLHVKSSLCSFNIEYTCLFIVNDKHRIYFTSIICMYLCVSDIMSPQPVKQLLLIFCYLLFNVFWTIWPVNLVPRSRYFLTLHIKRGHKLSYNLTILIILYCLYLSAMFSKISQLTNDLGHSACCISPSHQCSNIPSCCMSIYYNLVILKLNNNPLIVVCTLVNHYVDNLVSRATCTKTCVGVVSRQAGDIYHKTILQPYVFNVCCYTCRPTFIYTMEFFVVNDFTNSHECIVLVLLLFYYVVYIYNGG